jgi:hypothetical protein
MFGLFKQSWQKRLANADEAALERDVAEIVSHALRENDQVGAVHVTSPMSLVAVSNDGEHQLFLYNLLPRLKGTDPELRADVVLQFLNAMHEKTEPALRDLIPILKGVAWLNDAKKMVQQQSPADKLEENQIASIPFVADMHIAFAFDRPSSMAFATVGMLKDAGANVDEKLIELAKEHLRERLPPVNVQRGPASCMVTCGGNFEASVLLFDDLVDEIAKLFEGELIAIAPSRDVLMFTGSQVEAGLEEILEIARRVQEGGNYLLSSIPIVRRNGSWRSL